MVLTFKPFWHAADCYSFEERDYNHLTGVCGQGMSNVFAAPPIKYF